jgi:hypothetical protein
MVRKDDNLPPSSADVTESGSLNLPELSVSHRLVIGLLYECWETVTNCNYIHGKEHIQGVLAVKSVQNPLNVQVEYRIRD